MQKHVTCCDICARIQGDSNHWLEAAAILDAESHAITLVLGAQPKEKSGIEINGLAGLVQRRDICSQECLQKLIAQVLKATATPA